MNIYKIIIIFFSFLLIFGIVSCQKKPNIEAPMYTFTLTDDINLGARINYQIFKNSQIYPVLDTFDYISDYSYLNKVKDTLLKTGVFTNTSNFNWKIIIIHNDSSKNAFCTPGGYIYLYTGMLKILDNEAQLAGLIAHLIIHSDSRYTTNELKDFYGVDYLQHSISTSDSQYILNIINSFFQNHIIYKYEEHYTDTQSVKCLYKTEYDAYAIHDFFYKLTLIPKIDFLITNPSPTDRLTNIAYEFNELGGVHGQSFQVDYTQFLTHLP